MLSFRSWLTLDFKFFLQEATYITKKNGSRRVRKMSVRKMKVPTHSVLELELGNTAADIHWRREEGEAREREEKSQKERE